DLIHDHWKAQHSAGGKQFEDFWETSLHDGVMAGSALPPVTPQLNLNYSNLPAPQSSSSSIEIVFRPDPTIGDGRWANNGWLQELPKPLSTLTWANAVILSPATARRLRVRKNDVVRLDLGGKKVEGPVWVMPGHANESATLYLGYGRHRAGHVGSGFGINGYRLRASGALQFADGLAVEKTGKQYFLAQTQNHHPID